MNYHPIWSSTDHSPYHYRLFWTWKPFGTTTEVVIRNDLAIQSWEGSSVKVKLLKAPFVAVPVATLAPLGRAITTHCDVCVVVDWVLTALLRVLSSRRLMRLWWTRPTRVFQQSVPLRSQWSTVFPHTNTYYGEFRAPCSVNICFPKWFCYWAPLPHIRAGSGLDHRLSTLLRSLSNML